MNRMPSRRAMRPTEQSLQRTCIEYLRACVPTPAEGGPVITAINPIPGKSIVAAGRSKAMGMRAGAPDLLLVFRGRFIAIEFKRPGRARQPSAMSRAQMAFHDDWLINGGIWWTLDTLDDFRAALAVLGIPTRERKAA